MATTRSKAASATKDPKTPQKDPTPLSTNAIMSATHPNTPFSINAKTPASVDSLLLDDWWLVKAEEKGLAVGGYFSRGDSDLGVRGFTSSAIIKRHRANVVETADGIMITVTGILNRSRTHQNGFPCEIYNQFLVGFPYDWEEYAAVVSGEDSAGISASLRNSAYPKFKMSSGNNQSNSFPFSIDDLPVTKARDIMMLSFGESDYSSLVKSIFSDIQRMSMDSAFGHMGSSTDSPTKHKKAKVQDDKNMFTEENKKSCQKSPRGPSFPGISEGASTRNMGRKVDLWKRISTRSMSGRNVSPGRSGWKKVSTEQNQRSKKQ